MRQGLQAQVSRSQRRVASKAFKRLFGSGKLAHFQAFLLRLQQVAEVERLVLFVEVACHSHLVKAYGGSSRCVSILTTRAN